MAKFINNLLICLIRTLRPLLGYAACKFPDGCTKYAVDQLRQKPLPKALWDIIKRLLLCSPLYWLLRR